MKKTLSLLAITLLLAASGFAQTGTDSTTHKTVVHTKTVTHHSTTTSQKTPVTHHTTVHKTTKATHPATEEVTTDSTSVHRKVKKPS